MGGHVYRCDCCNQWQYSFHSCSHRNCPQCGRTDTAKWVDRELSKRIGAPYFMVVFTLPAELRRLFFGPQSKAIYDLFFNAASRALAETLGKTKAPGAEHSGFTGILHTWNQQLHFHPHIHYIVPGAGIDAEGNVVTVKNANFLAPLPILREAFRRHFREQLEAYQNSDEWRELRKDKKLADEDIDPDPSVWNKKWGVYIKPFGDGANAIKYLGFYVCRSAISDARIVAIGKDTVTFRWKDRSQNNRQRISTIPGVEFVTRYLRHVLPAKLRVIRYFGYCHPAAKKKRERIAFHTGKVLRIGPDPSDTANDQTDSNTPTRPCCPGCQQPMKRFEHTLKELKHLNQDLLTALLRAPPNTPFRLPRKTQ